MDRDIQLPEACTTEVITQLSRQEAYISIEIGETNVKLLAMMIMRHSSQSVVSDPEVAVRVTESVLELLPATVKAVRWRFSNVALDHHFVLVVAVHFICNDIRIHHFNSFTIFFNIKLTNATMCTKVKIQQSKRGSMLDMFKVQLI